MLTLALVVSLLVHLLLLSKFSLSQPNLINEGQVINVRLMNVQAMQKTTVAATTKAYQYPNISTTELPQLKLESIVNAAGPTADNTKNKASSADVPPKTSPQPEIASIEPNQLTENTIKPLPQPYHHVETDFEVYQGSQTNLAGKARIVFDISENRTYSLISITEANGLVSLFSNALVQKSEGVVLDTGLRPNYYSNQYGSDGKKVQSANFAWSDGIIEMSSEQGKKTEVLPAGTQDFLSAMYQFMFIPPLENTEISVSDGENLNNYHYIFQGEEKIATKLGELNTIHLLKSDNIDNVKTELWLALDYQYLPVKIRKTEKDGNFIEQIAIKIFTTTP